MSDAIESQGFKLEMQTAAGPIVWTEVKEVKDFNGFDGEAQDIDVTHLQSTAKEYLQGLQDFGNFAVTVNYLPEDPGQVAMRASKASREKELFRVTYSDGSTDEFAGFVKNAPKSGGVDQAVESSFSIKITGDVENTPAP